MLTVVCFLWRQEGYHVFLPEHVNVLASAVARNYQRPHRFVCVTDETEGFSPAVERVEPWWDRRLDLVKNPSKAGVGPNCYRRLALWRSDAGERLGGAERIVSLDIDTVVTGDLAPLWDRPEPIVLWRDPLFPAKLFNGSMVLLTPGARPDIWSDFIPGSSPALTRDNGYFGSDQAWISYKINGDAAAWAREDGVYSFRLLGRKTLDRTVYRTMPPLAGLPVNARIVMFHGDTKPWDAAVRTRYPWIEACWR